MFLPHELFATLTATEHSDLLYGSLQEATRSHYVGSTVLAMLAYMLAFQGPRLLGRAARSEMGAGASGPECRTAAHIVLGELVVNDDVFPTDSGF